MKLPDIDIELPNIYDIIYTADALELCRHFRLDNLVDRIESDPGRYKKEWKFDGCSCIPDKIMGLFTDRNWKNITYKCCLPHDLSYAYGELGNKIERKRVDKTLYKNLQKKAGMPKWIASCFFLAARIGGHEVLDLSFTWGFAHIKKRSRHIWSILFLGIRPLKKK